MQGPDSLSLEDFLPQQNSILFKDRNAIITCIVPDFTAYSQKMASTSSSQQICLWRISAMVIAFITV